MQLCFFRGNQDEVVEMLRSEGNWEARLLDWAQEASKTFFMKNSD